jgi:hypothetical protein
LSLVKLIQSLKTHEVYSIAGKIHLRQQAENQKEHAI